jgi:hypothetical protein
LAEKYEGRVTFVGVSNNDTVEDGKEYVDRFDVPYAMANAPEVWEAFGDPSRPSTIVIDARGDISSTVVGPISVEGLTMMIEQEL